MWDTTACFEGFVELHGPIYFRTHPPTTLFFAKTHVTSFAEVFPLPECDAIIVAVWNSLLFLAEPMRGIPTGHNGPILPLG